MISCKARLAFLLLLLAGCATGGRDVNQGVAEVTFSPRMETALAQLKTKIENSRGIIASNINDVWTMRILAGAGALLGLSYPVGKIIWLVFGSAVCTVRSHTRKGKSNGP